MGSDSLLIFGIILVSTCIGAVFYAGVNSILDGIEDNDESRGE